MNSSHSGNPRQIVCAAAGAATGVALTPVVAPIVLGWFGFSAVGVVAGKFPSLVDQLARQHLTPQGPLGSAAAGIQAAIGNIAAGSGFAVAQSIAMGGAIPVAVTAVGASLGAGVGTAAAGTGSDGEEPKEGDPTDKDASQDEAGQDGTRTDTLANWDLANRVYARRNRCPECRRRRERYCKHTQE
jgi:hypothetical protein